MKPGDYVRFAFLPADSLALPKRVSAVRPDGSLALEGKEGYYAAYLFVVVDALKTGRIKMASLSQSCSWCDELNVIPLELGAPAVYCSNCGHRADVARLYCDCSRCRKVVVNPAEAA